MSDGFAAAMEGLDALTAQMAQDAAYSADVRQWAAPELKARVAQMMGQIDGLLAQTVGELKVSEAQSQQDIKASLATAAAQLQAIQSEMEVMIAQRTSAFSLAGKAITADQALKVASALTASLRQAASLTAQQGMLAGKEATRLRDFNVVMERQRKTVLVDMKKKRLADFLGKVQMVMGALEVALTFTGVGAPVALALAGINVGLTYTQLAIYQSIGYGAGMAAILAAPVIGKVLGAGLKVGYNLAKKLLANTAIVRAINHALGTVVKKVVNAALDRAMRRSLHGHFEYVVDDAVKAARVKEALLKFYLKNAKNPSIKWVDHVAGAKIDTVTGKILLSKAYLTDQYKHLAEGLLMEELHHFHQLVTKGYLGKVLTGEERQLFEDQVVARLLKSGLRVFRS